MTFTSYFLIPNSYLLLGYYGFGNLGDELLLKACIKILNEQGIKNENIIVLSNNPGETRKNFDVAAVNRWKISEVAKALRKSESLILGGGGLFQDSTSIKSCIYYWGIVRLAKLFGLKIFALGQSIGPLNSRLAKFLTCNALRLCEKVQVRDENSFNIAKNFSLKNLEIAPDLVMQVGIRNEAEAPLAEVGSKSRKEILLVNLRPYKHLEKFVSLVVPRIKDFPGKKIGVALSPDDEKILNANKKILGLDEIKLLTTFEEAAKIFSLASEAIGMRLHFGVLAKIFETPVILLPYDIKVSEFARQYNITVIKFAYEQT